MDPVSDDICAHIRIRQHEAENTGITMAERAHRVKGVSCMTRTCRHRRTGST